MKFTKDKGATICLCMIVKDSAEHILRCLESVKPIVDSYAIIDTGSRDDTIKIIKKFFRYTKGKIIKNKYPIDPEFNCLMDFSKARTDSLKLAEGRGDYVLIMDSDETLLIDPAFDKENLTDDLYNVLTADSAEYTRPRLIKNDRNWWFEDVVHEWLESGMTIRTRSTIPTLKFHLYPKAGNRHLHRNLKLLTAGNKERPDYTRYIFYLAQTYRDLGQYKEAIPWYEKAEKMCQWHEEKWFSMYMLGFCYERLEDHDKSLVWYMKAYDFLPVRTEPLFKLANRHRLAGKHHIAKMYAQAGAYKPIPNDIHLFIEGAVYKYSLLEELNISSYWTEDYKTCIEACDEMLSRKEVPDNIYLQTEKNKVWAVNQLKNKGEIEKSLVIELPAGYDGIGDHLFFSHLPRIAKESGKWTKVYVSNHNTYKANGYKDLVWGKNPYVDGFVDERGTMFVDDRIRNMLNTGIKEYRDKTLMENIALIYGLPIKEGASVMPIIHLAIPDMSELHDAVVFDGNYKHFCGLTADEVKKGLIEYNLKPDAKMAPFKLKGDPVHGSAVPKYINIWLGNVLSAPVESDSLEGLIWYLSVIKSCKKFVCLMSGGSVLGPALGIPVTVLDNSDTNNLYKFEGFNNHIYLK